MIALYVRVSTDEQATKGYSIEEQMDQCRQKANSNEIIEYVDDGYTGEILNRPALSRLREDVQSGLVHKIVCYDPDRLSRNLLVQLLLDDEFKKNNVELTFVRGDYQNNPEGKMFFSMRGAISEFEKAKIKERTMGGKVRKAKTGRIVKNDKIYGYDYNKEKNMYVINEKEANIVRMIFESYTNNRFQGINGLALHLSEMGVPTKKGAKVWHRQVVRQILMNEAYTGNYYQNKWDTVGNYVKKQSGEKVEYGKLRPKDDWILTKIPAIITQKQFDFAQQLIEQGRRRNTKHGRHEYLLSGLVRCDRCGNTMTGKRTLSHGKDFFIYHCRKNTAGYKNKGCGRQMSENKLNHYVWEKLEEWLNNPEKIKEYQDEENTPRYIEEEIKHLADKIEKTKKGRKRLIKLVSLGNEDEEDDDLDLEEIKTEIRELQIAQKELTFKYNQLLNELEEDKNKKPSEVGLEKAVEYYTNNKGSEFTFDDKQYLIRLAVKEITIINSELVHITLF